MPRGSASSSDAINTLTKYGYTRTCTDLLSTRGLGDNQFLKINLFRESFIPVFLFFFYSRNNFFGKLESLKILKITLKFNHFWKRFD